MSQDPFAQYALPLGLAEGVKIPLPNTEAVFTIKLPASTNEDFNMELMTRISTNVDDQGEVRVDPMSFQIQRKAMFFDQCVLSADGLPEGMSAEDFFAAYPLAAKYIYDRATELAAKADEEVNEALGKSESTPNGKHSGTANLSSTTTSSKRESKSKPAALN
jgi:hypothetical protein